MTNIKKHLTEADLAKPGAKFFAKYGHQPLSKEREAKEKKSQYKEGSNGPCQSSRELRNDQTA